MVDMSVDDKYASMLLPVSLKLICDPAIHLRSDIQRASKAAVTGFLAEERPNAGYGKAVAVKTGKSSACPPRSFFQTC